MYEWIIKYHKVTLICNIKIYRETIINIRQKIRLKSLGYVRL
jgi:hypothetical protein